MIDSNILHYSVLEPLNVSRETFDDFEEFRSLILERNKKINLISQSSEEKSKGLSQNSWIIVLIILTSLSLLFWYSLS